MTNLNEGVGKKIVEALKKQSEIESSGIVEQPAKEPENLGIDVSSIDVTSDTIIPECYKLWIMTFGCAHNFADGEYMKVYLVYYLLILNTHCFFYVLNRHILTSP